MVSFIFDIGSCAIVGLRRVVHGGRSDRFCRRCGAELTSAKMAMPTQDVVGVCCIYWFGWLVEGPPSKLAAVGN